jgi:hypothetical protein
VEAEPLGGALGLAPQRLSGGEQAIQLGLVARVGGGLHPCEDRHLLIEVVEPGVQFLIVAGRTIERLQVGNAAAEPVRGFAKHIRSGMSVGIALSARSTLAQIASARAM